MFFVCYNDGDWLDSVKMDAAVMIELVSRPNLQGADILQKKSARFLKETKPGAYMYDLYEVEYQWDD